MGIQSSAMSLFSRATLLLLVGGTVLCHLCYADEEFMDIADKEFDGLLTISRGDSLRSAKPAVASREKKLGENEGGPRRRRRSFWARMKATLARRERNSARRKKRSMACKKLDGDFLRSAEAFCKGTPVARRAVAYKEKKQKDALEKQIARKKKPARSKKKSSRHAL